MSIGADLPCVEISEEDNLTYQGTGVIDGVNPIDTSGIIADYNAHLTLNQLAFKYKNANTTIRRVLLENGVHVRGYGEHAKKYTLDETYFDRIDTQEKAYILGFIYADGNIYFDKRNPATVTVSLALQKRDVEVLEFIKTAIGSDHPLYFEKVTQSIRLAITNKRFCRSLIAAGVTPKKSLTLQFPTEDIVPRHLVRHFVRGYFDGDGTVSYNDVKGHFSIGFIGTWEFMMSILQELHEKTHFPVKPQLPYKQNNTPENVFKIGWCGHHTGSSVRSRAAWYLYDYMYKDCTLSLTRKREAMEHIAKHYKP